MRFQNYLKEDAVTKALDIGEPEIGKSYPSEKVKRYLETIEAGIQAMTKRKESEANDAVVADLRDKKEKWSNVKKETKPVKTKLEVPPGEEEGGNPPPQEEEEEPPPKNNDEEDEKPTKKN